MASESSTRIWRANKAAGRAWPTICHEDDVLDFMVMEAVYLKVTYEDAQLREDAEKEAQRKEFKSDRSSLEQFR